METYLLERIVPENRNLIEEETLRRLTRQKVFDAMDDSVHMPMPINEFVEWYCSEPRLPLNRNVVLRYRISLQERHLAPATINLRLAAVRRVTVVLNALERRRASLSDLVSDQLDPLQL